MGENMQSQQLTVKARADDYDKGSAESGSVKKPWCTPRVEAFDLRRTSTGTNSEAEDGIFGS